MIVADCVRIFFFFIWGWVTSHRLCRTHSVNLSVLGRHAGYSHRCTHSPGWTVMGCKSERTSLQSREFPQSWHRREPCRSPQLRGITGTVPSGRKDSSADWGHPGLLGRGNKCAQRWPETVRRLGVTEVCLLRVGCVLEGMSRWSTWRTGWGWRLKDYFLRL